MRDGEAIPLVKGILMNSPPAPEGPGSVTGAPNLPAGFADTFTSHYIDTGELRLHAVTGGDGPPLLLVRGWPQTWYAWRMLMPALARDFSVVIAAIAFPVRATAGHPAAGAGQVRGAYSIESNGQSRSTHARTASWRTGSSAAQSARTQDWTEACRRPSAPPLGSWPLAG